MINVWATWCGPCVAELPEFVTMNRMYRGRPFRLVTISLDDPDKQADALRVLKENHVAAVNYVFKSSRPRRVRRGTGQGMARPGALHLGGRSGREESSTARSERSIRWK